MAGLDLLHWSEMPPGGWPTPWVVWGGEETAVGGSTAMAADGGPVVSTASGDLRGVELDGVHRFAGIPFAKPPVGPLRFRPPQASGPWEGVLDATAFGAVSPQSPSILDMVFGFEEPRQDEDCLTLNVWAPAEATPTAALPVMVWIHGGGFELGAGSQSMYDGAAFARSGVVFVSINYRLGTLGFAEFGALDPDYAGSANNGLRDQLLALQWVHEHIASFGGNADEITVFGQSAGAMSIATLLSTGQLKGLVTRAICQSGAAGATSSMELAVDTTTELCAHLGVDSMAGLLSADASELLAGHRAIVEGRFADPEATLARLGDMLSFLAFRPVRDGSFVPADVLGAIAAGSGDGIDLIVGSTADEWAMFALMDTGTDTDERVQRRIELLGADPHTVLAAYNAELPESTPSATMSALLTDVIFRVPAVELANAHASHGQVRSYLFSWASPAFGGMLGSCHGMELPFVFRGLSMPSVSMLVGVEAPVELESVMHDAWVSLAKGEAPTLDTVNEGSTPWPAHNPTDHPMVEFGDHIRIVHDLRATTRQLWQTQATLTN